MPNKNLNTRWVILLKNIYLRPVFSCFQHNKYKQIFQNWVYDIRAMIKLLAWNCALYKFDREWLIDWLIDFDLFPDAQGRVQVCRQAVSLCLPPSSRRKNQADKRKSRNSRFVHHSQTQEKRGGEKERRKDGDWRWKEGNISLLPTFFRSCFLSVYVSLYLCLSTCNTHTYFFVKIPHPLWRDLCSWDRFRYIYIYVNVDSLSKFPYVTIALFFIVVISIHLAIAISLIESYTHTYTHKHTQTLSHLLK